MQKLYVLPTKKVPMHSNHVSYHLEETIIGFVFQFGPNHFLDWPTLRIVFLTRVRTKKSEGKNIESLGSLKQKGDETIEEFYGKVYGGSIKDESQNQRSI